MYKTVKKNIKKPTHSDVGKKTKPSPRNLSCHILQALAINFGGQEHFFLGHRLWLPHVVAQRWQPWRALLHRFRHWAPTPRPPWGSGGATLDGPLCQQTLPKWISEDRPKIPEHKKIRLIRLA